MVLDGNKEASLPNRFRYTLPAAPIAIERNTGGHVFSQRGESRYSISACSVAPAYSADALSRFS